MTNIVSTAAAVDGTADSDIIIVQSAGANVQTTVNAGEGNDVVIADHGPVLLDAAAGNISLATATSIDTAALWTTSADPLVGNASIAHMAVLATASGEVDMFKVTLVAGATINLDIDFGYGPYGGPSFDSQIQLLDAVGNVVSTNDDSLPSDGGLGSIKGPLTDTLDSYLTYTASSAGTYYIKIGSYSGYQPIPAGSTYILNVSASGHAATGTAPAYGDILNGGNGNDYLIGNNLADTLQGGAGNDLINGAGGTDSASYADAAAGVTVSLAVATAQNTVGAGTDTLAGIEDLLGSAWDDTLTGDGSNNRLGGRLGNDTLNGGGGNDILLVYAGEGSDNVDGGADTDTLFLFTSVVGWEVDLSTGFGSTTLSDFLVVNSIEKVVGTTHNDTFTSLANAEMEGLGGDDVIRANTTGGERLDGGIGYDTLDTTANNVLNSPYSINLATGVATNAVYFLNFESVVSGNSADTIVGSDTYNIISSGGGNDNLDGGANNDVLEGGDGDDTINGGADIDYASYAFSSAGVTVSLAIAGAQDTIGAGNDTLAGIENLRGSTYGDALTGDAGSNILDAGAGNDTLEGGLGVDVLFGGAGSDTASYAHAAAGVTVSLLQLGNYQATGGGGNDYLDSIENLTGSDFADTLTGDGNQNVLKGGNGDDTILYQGSSAGNDTIDGGAGSDDFLNVAASSFAWTVDFQAGTGSGDGDNFTISNIERILGSDFDDMLTSRNSGTATIIDGGLGNDMIRAGSQVINNLNGGDGIDTLDMTGYNNATLRIVNLATGTSNFAGEILVNFENLSTGASLDVITGTSGDNIIDAGAGNDTIIGGLGNDTIDGGLGLDWASYSGAGSAVTVSLVFADAQDTLGAGMDTLGNIENLEGSAFDDTLAGDAGDNWLVGGAGADMMTGGTGNDRFLIDDKDDKVLEAGGGGTDTVESLVDYSIAGQDIEILTLLTGSAAVKGVGNTLDNTITGNENANFLYGGAGADTVIGGLGNDTYYVENLGDVVIEDAAAGVDTVSSTVSFTLGVNVERLVLTGAAAINGTGNALANNLTGNGAANILDGGAGVDVMKGGGGNDTYYVDHKDDVTEEAGGGGNDTVYASADYSVFAQNIENLILTGSAIKGTGNGLNNTITGNAAANFLYGGGGNDTLLGGLGNDNYYIDGMGDLVVEAAGEGTDTVNSAGTYELGADIEVLRLTGSADINGTGNGLANIITGNTNNNVIDGGVGADTMKGGAGNDTYKVDNAGDAITELSGEGTDSVSASVSHTLAANVENLTLTGASAINGTGNSLANALNGNAAVNTLHGGAGDDALHGGGGSDMLTGGAGLDGFWFETALGAGNIDNITDFAAADDSIHLDRSIFTGIAANGALAAGAFRLGTAALDADDRILYDQATGNLWYDADGSGVSAAVQFAHVVAGTAMTAADFFAVP